MELKIERLSKTYANGVQALQEVSLNIPAGMFGLLGPNGAGKSTLMRIIATLQEPDSGSIFLDELDVLKKKSEVRKILGYLPQEFGLYPKVDAETLLDHFARLKGIHNARERKEIVDHLLHKTNLYAFRKKNLGGYSGGMKQRFGIAQALLGSPKLIIVDEPTAGLDPAERNRFHNLLSEIGENIVVILSTHIIEDVSSLCQSMAIINKGKVLLQGKPQEVLESYRGKIWKRIIEKHELPTFEQNFHVISHLLVGGKFEIHVYSDSQPDPAFSIVEASLEDVYFNTVKPE
ncbi:MAG: ABC transporter ATP-binding protein [Bacteroidia bacterium]|nr:ABC transporter ATP-binding protein [Bacteroidia bacterium]